MYSSLSTSLVAVHVVLSILSTLFVAIRFKVRRSTKAGLGADDYTILIALVTQRNRFCLTNRLQPQLTLYHAAPVLIYAATAGGVGNTEEHIANNPSESAIYTKIIRWKEAGPLGLLLTCYAGHLCWTDLVRVGDLAHQSIDVDSVQAHTRD